MVYKHDGSWECMDIKEMLYLNKLWNNGKALESLVSSDLINTYRGKRVLVTGASGFKGSWLCLCLKNLGSEVIGYFSSQIVEEIIMLYVILRAVLIT